MSMLLHRPAPPVYRPTAQPAVATGGPSVYRPAGVVAVQQKSGNSHTAPAVYCPAPAKEVLQAKWKMPHWAPGPGVGGWPKSGLGSRVAQARPMSNMAVEHRPPPPVYRGAAAAGHNLQTQMANGVK